MPGVALPTRHPPFDKLCALNLQVNGLQLINPLGDALDIINFLGDAQIPDCHFDGLCLSRIFFRLWFSGICTGTVNAITAPGKVKMD